MSERVEEIRTRCVAASYVDGPPYEDMEFLLAHLAAAEARATLAMQESRAALEEVAQAEAREQGLRETLSFINTAYGLDSDPETPHDVLTILRAALTLPPKGPKETGDD